MLNEDNSWTKEQITSYQAELKITDDNRILANDKTTFTSTQVKELADLYRAPPIELRKKYVFDLSKNRKLLPKKLHASNSR